MPPTAIVSRIMRGSDESNTCWDKSHGFGDRCLTTRPHPQIKKAAWKIKRLNVLKASILSYISVPLGLHSEPTKGRTWCIKELHRAKIILFFNSTNLFFVIVKNNINSFLNNSLKNIVFMKLLFILLAVGFGKCSSTQQPHKYIIEQNENKYETDAIVKEDNCILFEAKTCGCGSVEKIHVCGTYSIIENAAYIESNK